MPEDIKQRVIVETETRGSESIARLKAEILSLGKLGNIGRIAGGMKQIAANQRKVAGTAKLFDADAARALKVRLATESKLNRQRLVGIAASERAQAAVDRTAIGSIRNRVAVQSRLSRQRRAEERASERATAAAARAAITADRVAARERIRSAAQAERVRLAEVRNVANAERQRVAQQRQADRERVSAARASIAATRAAVGFQTRMSRQKAAEEARSVAYVERGRVAASRAAARAERQRLADARTADRERERGIAQSERDAAAAARRKIQLDNFRMRLRSRYERDRDREHGRDRNDVVRHGRDAGRYGADAYGRLTRGPALAAAAGMAGTGTLVKRSLGVEADTDAAEIGTRIYGGLDQKAARSLRDQWAAPLAESLGTNTAKLLTAWTDAIKLGIPGAGARAFAELSTQTSSAWEVPFETVTDVLGTMNTLLTSNGSAFDPQRLKSIANTIQHLAAKQSTTPERMLEFMKQGAGGGQLLGQSLESTAAFGSASTSLGNRPGESGRMLDYLAGRIIELPRLTRKKGDEGKQARDLVRSLGFSTADDMDRQRRADPEAFLPTLMERFGKIRDAKKQDEAIRFFAGREWLGEFGRMVKGLDTYKEAVNLQKEAQKLDAIGEVWNLHRTKLAFVAKQFSAGWQNILGEFGKELSPLARQAGDVFLTWTARLRAGGLAARFRAAIGGFVEGLGFRDLPSLLKGILGEPGEGNAGAISAWRAGFREFAGGIRDVVDSIRSVVGAFTGGSPETIARWTGRILTLSAALVVLSPVLGVLGGIASALLALGSTAATVWAGLKVAGLVGGAGAAGGAIGAGALAAAGGIIAAGFLAAIANRMGILQAPDPSKGWKRGILEFLDPGLANRILGKEKPETQGWVDPPGKPLKDALDGHAKVLKQSFNRQTGIGSLIRKASFTDDGPIRDLKQVVAAQGARLQLTALGSTGSIGGALGSSGAGSAATSYGSGGAIANILSRPGERLPPSALGRRGIIGGGGLGGGVTKPLLKGEAAANAKTAYDFFRSKGLSHEATSGILASMKQESGFNPGARGDGGRAHGLFQHHPDRRAAIMRATGVNMSSGTVQQQLEGAWWEMNHGDKGAQRALGILKRPGISAREAGAAFVHNFERPLRDERASRGAMAEGFSREFGAGGAGSAGGVTEGSGNVLSRMQALRTSGRVLNDQCVSLAKAAVGANGSVTTWQRGVNAAEGTLREGTPVATFLNRDGSQSSRYAGGGTGTMGAKLDHAAVFNRYIRDQAGKIIGMNVAEQFKGSGGVRSKNYYFGRGYGEANGSNYNAVLGPDGKPLGGDRNPMSGAKALAGNGPKPETDGPWKSMVDESKVRDWKRSVGGNVLALFEANKAKTLENRIGPERTKALLGDPDILSKGFRYDPSRNSPADLAQRLPFRPRTAEDLARTVPAPSPNRAGRGGNGDTMPNVTIHQNINGSNLDAGQVAAEAQKRAREAMSWRAHDVYHDV